MNRPFIQQTGFLVGANHQFFPTTLSIVPPPDPAAGSIAQWGRVLPAEAFPVAFVLTGWNRLEDRPLAIVQLTPGDADTEAIVARFRAACAAAWDGFPAWIEWQLLALWQRAPDSFAPAQTVGDILDQPPDVPWPDTLDEIVRWQSHTYWFEHCDLWIPPFGAPEPWSTAAQILNQEVRDYTDKTIAQLRSQSWALVCKRHEAAWLNVKNARLAQMRHDLLLYGRFMAQLHRPEQRLRALFAAYRRRPLGKVGKREWPVLCALADQHGIDRETLHYLIFLHRFPATKKIYDATAAWLDTPHAPLSSDQ